MENPGLCLSTLSVLRCSSLSRLENQILIIPTALEVIFTSTLIFTNWRSGRRFLLLTAEGWLYLALAILELLSHTMSEVQTSLNVFRAIDISIAAGALLPILLYTIFLYLFMRAELVDILPTRFQSICRYTLALFIPAIVAVNGVASFLGIAYRLLRTPRGSVVIGIGFNTRSDNDVWTFLTSTALALHTAYQALNFCLAFFRIAKAFIIQRQIEQTSTDEAYLFKGIGWMAGGLKLGAIETVVGFAQGGFGGALTRRILRFLSRACLCIGIVKGADIHENFKQVRDEMSQKPRRLQISNPRFSTFAQMSPSATAFHSAPRAPPAVGGSKLRLDNGLPGMSQLSDMKDDDEAFQRKQRVTVHYQAGAPILHMRFSALDMPSPATISEKVKASNPQKSVHNRASSYHPSSVLPAETARTPIYARHTRAFSEYSVPDSLNSLAAVRELAAQFPGLPPRVTDKGLNQVPWQDPYPSTQNQSSLLRGDSSGSESSRSGKLSRTLSHSSSIRRKPVPRIEDNVDPFSEESDEPFQLEVPLPPAQSSHHQPHPSVTDSFGSTPLTNFSLNGRGGNDTDAATTPGDEDPFVFDEQPKQGDRESVQPFQGVHQYLLEPLVEEEPENETLTRIRKAVPASRIKSVGSAPRRSTPNPVKTSHHLTRGSIYIEPILIPPKPHGMPEVEIIQEDMIGQSVASDYSSALRDSDLFGSQGAPLSQYR